MKRTTVLTLAMLTGWAAAAAAQTPEPGEQPKTTRTEPQVRQENGEVQKQDTGAPAARSPQGFADTDGDGICDNFQGQGRGRAGVGERPTDAEAAGPATAPGARVSGPGAAAASDRGPARATVTGPGPRAEAGAETGAKKEARSITPPTIGPAAPGRP